uniref:Small ribosomal subunit protein uS9c n=1 Tax=Hafniomonas laevis TaxID=436124 RepID=A0A0S2LNL1_9CHLO|nr:ribosomal protein S9 [Hafniomonas laevis]ALO63077.1 ribosomal protein S9 [Hafniomonas laevis]
MEILARGVGRRKEAVAQATLVKGTGQIIINEKPANLYLHNNTFSLLAVNAPSTVLTNMTTSEGTQEGDSSQTPNIFGASTVALTELDTIVKVKGGGLIGQTEAIRLAIARALCALDQTTETLIRKTLRTQGFLTQDSRIKERRKYGLKKARKASQYHKR